MFFETWEMSDCKSVLTPGEASSTVELPVEGIHLELDPEDVLRAQKLAVSFIWLSTRTRPDICYAQSRISSMATKAPKAALLEGFRVLRYLQGTKEVGLHFKACDGYEECCCVYGCEFLSQQITDRVSREARDERSDVEIDETVNGLIKFSRM